MAERRHEADARQTAQQTARQLFYSSPVRDPQAMALRATGEASPRTAAKQEAPTPESQLLGKKPGAPVGIRYAILRQVVEGSTFANAGAEFRAGDLVRLSVESNADGFVYLFRQEAHDGWQQLDSGRIRKRTPYQIPRGEPVRLAEGGMTLILMLLQKEPPVILNLPLSRDQENRRILVERMKEPVPTGGNAEVVYAVDPSPAPESPVIVEIPLKLR
jgi:hypothetical protein